MTESLTVLVTWLRARWHCTVQFQFRFLAYFDDLLI